MKVPESGEETGSSWSCTESCVANPSGCWVPGGVSGVACCGCSTSMDPGAWGPRKSQMRIVSSCELLMIWKSSNCSRNTLPECSWTERDRESTYTINYQVTNDRRTDSTQTEPIRE